MSYFKFSIPARLVPHCRGGLIALALILFFLVNLQGIEGGFFTDDSYYLLNNHALQSLGFTELWKLLPDSARYNGLDWGPLRDLFYKAVWSLYGEVPLPFKILNYVLYAAAVVSAYRAALAVARLFGQPASAGIADVPLMAALVFALHPTHIESLQAIWGTKDLLMAAFGLAAFPPYVRWLQARRWESAACSTVLLACAGLSKGASVSLLAPMWLMAYASCERGSVARKLCDASLRLLPVAVLPLFVFLLFQWASPLQQFHGSDVSNWTDRPLIILGGQSLIALVPWPLSLFYAPYGELMPLYLSVGAAVLCAGAFSAWSFLRRPALVTFGVLFFVSMMLPYLQLMPFATGSMIADRFGFTGILGLGLAGATLLSRFAAPYRGSVAAGLLLTYLLLGGLRASGWDDPAALVHSDARRTQAELSRPEFLTLSENGEVLRAIRVQVKEQGGRMSRAQADDVIDRLAKMQEALAKPRVRTADIAALSIKITAENDVAGIYREVYAGYGAHPALGADASSHFLRNGRLRQAMQWAEFAASTPGVPPAKLALAYRNYGNAAAAAGNLRAGAGALYQSIRIEANPIAACAIVELQRLHPGEVYLADGIAKLCQSG
jgi:hypothetical protein